MRSTHAVRRKGSSVTPSEERALLLAARVDPDFPETYRLAYTARHGHEPDQATLAEAVAIYAQGARERIAATMPTSTWADADWSM